MLHHRAASHFLKLDQSLLSREGLNPPFLKHQSLLSLRIRSGYKNIYLSCGVPHGEMSGLFLGGCTFKETKALFRSVITYIVLCVVSLHGGQKGLKGLELVKSSGLNRQHIY